MEPAYRWRPLAAPSPWPAPGGRVKALRRALDAARAMASVEDPEALSAAELAAAARAKARPELLQWLITPPLTVQKIQELHRVVNPPGQGRVVRCGGQPGGEAPGDDGGDAGRGAPAEAGLAFTQGDRVPVGEDVAPRRGADGDQRGAGEAVIGGGLDGVAGAHRAAHPTIHGGDDRRGAVEHGVLPDEHELARRQDL